MKRIFYLALPTSAAIIVLTVSVLAQTMTAWPFFISVSPGAAPGLNELVVPLQVMDKSREDLDDLRLLDASGAEIPYALLVRRQILDKREISATVFNKATVGANTGEMSVDLGENPGDHNEVEIETTGSNFRRQVNVEGSDDGTAWRTLAAGSVIFSMTSQNQTVTANRVTYPTSRYRYLRVRVIADELSDRHAPTVNGVKVILAVRQPGQLTTWGLSVPPYELLRNQGAPASAWTIDLGARVPCDRLNVDFEEESFSRPFTIETMDDSQNIRLVASGELTRRIGEQRQPITIYFQKEEYVRKLRMLVTDYSNPMLSISSITAAAPARQLVYELKDRTAGPLRLYFGNPKATPPHYDFEKELPAKMTSTPAKSSFGSISNNSEYQPEPVPLTERVPWLIYVVLSLSSIALAWILWSLARTSLKRRTSPANTDSTGSV
jgi:hypothetical protein